MRAMVGKMGIMHRLQGFGSRVWKATCALVLASAFVVCGVNFDFEDGVSVGVESAEAATVQRSSLSAYSWSEIAAISDEIAAGDSARITEFTNYMNNGQTKSVSVSGTTRYVRLIGVNMYMKANGAGYAGLAWQFTAPLAGTYQMHTSATSNSITWANCALRTKLQSGGTVYNTMPSDMRSAMVQTRVPYYTAKSATSGDFNSLYYSSDLMWCPSIGEFYFNRDGTGVLSSWWSTHSPHQSGTVWLRDRAVISGATDYRFGGLMSTADKNSQTGGAYWWVSPMTNYDYIMPVFCTGSSTSTGLSSYTWAQLANISNDIAMGNTTRLNEFTTYMNRGDYKEITLTSGLKAAVQIAGLNHDDRADAPGIKAGITWTFVDTVPIAATYMYSSNTTNSNWTTSRVRSQLAKGGSIYTTLPTDLRNVIVPASKRYYAATSETALNKSTSLVSTDDVWVPTIAETNNNTTYGSGSQYALWKIHDYKINNSYWFRDRATGSSSGHLYGAAMSVSENFNRLASGLSSAGWWVDQSTSYYFVRPMFAIGAAVTGLEQYTWDELREISDKIAAGDTALTNEFTGYMKAGLSKNVSIDGTNYTVHIVGINHDKLTNGNGAKAGLTFGFNKEIAKHGWHTSPFTSSLSYATSEIREYMRDTLYATKLPADLRAAICSVDKVSSSFNGALTTTSETLFLPSVAELGKTLSGGMNISSEGTAYEAMPYLGNNMGVTTSATSVYWWLRSVYTSGTNYKPATVNGTTVSTYSIAYADGIAPMFAIGTDIALEGYTWAELGEISDKIVEGDASLTAQFTDYMNKGCIKTVTLTNGTKVGFRIVGVKEDSMKDGTALGLTWASTTRVTTAAMNATAVTNLTWQESELRAKLQPNGAIYKMFPSDLLDVLKPAYKQFNKPVSSTSVAFMSCEDYMWVPSALELGITPTNGIFGYMGDQYSWYKLKGSKGYPNGDTGYYFWLRDRDPNDSSYQKFAQVNYKVGGTYSFATYPPTYSSDSVVVMFAIGESNMLESYSWEELAAISDEIASGSSEHTTEFAEYMNSGKTKSVTLSNGTTLDFRIVGMNHDRRASGKKLGLTWGCVGSLMSSARMYDSSYTATGANWAESSLHGTLSKNGYTASLFPEDLRAVIVPAKKDYSFYDKSIATSLDYMWIPSTVELGYSGSSLWNNAGGYPGETYAYYAMGGAWPNANATYIWTRDRYFSSGSGYFYAADPRSKGVTYAGAQTTYSVSPMFAIGGTSSLDDYSWTDLRTIADEIAGGDRLRIDEFTEYMKAGATKTIRINTSTYKVHIVGINHDDKSSGGKAGLTFGFETQLSSSVWDKYALTTTSTYRNSYIRQQLNTGSIWDLLPPELTDVICPVQKISSSASGELMTLSEKLFLPSVTELGGFSSGYAQSSYVNGSSEGSRYAAMEYLGAKKGITLTGSYYAWTRSFYVSGSTIKPGSMMSSGQGTAYTGTSSDAVVPMFAIGESQEIVEDSGSGFEEEPPPKEDHTVDTTLVVGDSIVFTCDWQANTTRWDLAHTYASLEFEDILPPGLAISSYQLYRVTPAGQGNSNTEDIVEPMPSNAGTWVVSAMSDSSKKVPHYKLVYTAKNLDSETCWPLHNEFYRVIITCKVVSGGPKYTNTWNVYPNKTKLTSNAAVVSHFYPAEPELSKTADKTEAYIGEEVNYTIKVNLKGTQDCGVKDWTLWDHLPDRLSFDLASFAVTCATQYNLEIETEMVNGVERGVGWKLTGPLWLSSETRTITISYKGFANREGTYTNDAHFRYLESFDHGPDGSSPEYKELEDDVTVKFKGYPVVYHVDMGTDRQMEWEEYVEEITALYEPHNADTYEWEGQPVKHPDSHFVAAWYLDDELKTRYQNNRRPSDGELHLYARNKFYLEYKTSSTADILRSGIIENLYSGVQKNTSKNIWEPKVSTKLNMPTDEWTIYANVKKSNNSDHLTWPKNLTSSDPWKGLPWADEGYTHSSPTIYSYGDTVTLRAPRYLKLYTTYENRLRVLVPAPWSSLNNIYYKVDGSTNEADQITEVYIDRNWTVYKDWALSTFDGVVDQNQ